MGIRVGLGFDSHLFVAGRPLVLGGVRIPFELGLAGHSDADALTHAVIDALLGATGRGNIGERFPDSDPAYRDADSLSLLGEVWAELAKDGYRVVNVDCVLITEKPRLSPHLGLMSQRLAAAVGADAGRVSVKPKTTEGLGLVGRPGEGLAAMVVVLIDRPPTIR